MGRGSNGSPWMGRYRALFPIRSRGSFHLIAAERIDGSGARVVVVGAPSADRSGVRSALTEFARVHSLVDDPAVPRAEFAEFEDEPFVELACDAIADGHEVLRLFAESGSRLPYAQADALFTALRVALTAAHRVVDPKTGRPICMGRVCLGNMLFSREGRMYVVGFGHNVVLAREDGGLDGSSAVYQAPEIALGAQPTPASDYVAVLVAARSLLTFADVTAITGRVLEQGLLREENLELFKLVRYFDTRWIAEIPEARPPVEEGVRASQRIREIIGMPMDPDGLMRSTRELLEEHQPVIDLAEGEPQDRSAASLTVARDGAWAAESDGARVRLGRAPGRILVALVKQRERAPGEALGVWELFEAGWPGDSPVPEAGANRVYVTLTRLRQLGFRGAVQRFGDGWRIDPSVRVRWG